MPIVEWNGNFCLGVEQIDKEHKYLVGLINSFFDSCAKQSPIENIDTFLKELKAYTIYHFNSEEGMMVDFEYLKFAEHKERHKFFINTITELQNEFAAEKKDISVTTLTFLIHWLRQHILYEDADFCNFVARTRKCSQR
jgi:hemerythrin